MSSVTGRRLENGIGYLKIDHFQEQTIIEVTESCIYGKETCEV